MSQKNQLKSGVILSYVNLIIGNLIPFVYTPLMLSILGQAEYGLYTLSQTIVGYLSLLSFGMGSAVVRYITKYEAQGDRQKAQKMFGLFTVIFSVIACLTLVLGIILSFNIDIFYQNTLSIEELDRMKILIILCTINTAITFTFATYSSIVLVFEKYIFRQFLNIFSTIFVPCANVVVLLFGFGSVGMVLVATGINIICVITNVIYCNKCLCFKPDYHNMPFDELKSIFGFCIFVFIGSIVDMLFWATDKLIIGATIGTVAVAIYSIGATFNSIVTSVSTTISGVLTPRVTNMVFKDTKPKELSEIFIRVGRLQFLIIALAITGFAVYGREFISLWVGNNYSYSYWVALLTLIPVSVPLIQNTGIAIITAQNKHRFRSIVYLIIAIINAISTYFIVNYMGIVGAAMCSAISYIVGQGILMNWYYWKKIKIDIPLFWKNILKMSLTPLIMMVLGLLFNYFIKIDSWRLLVISVIVYTILYCIGMYFFEMNEYEKNTIKSPINKLVKKIKRS